MKNEDVDVCPMVGQNCSNTRTAARVMGIMIPDDRERYSRNPVRNQKKRK
jgi:hypothetical protein